MARVKIENDQLIITMKGARKVLTLKGEMSIPLANVSGVRRDFEWSQLPGLFEALRIPGSTLPGYRGGTFIQRDGKVFYDVFKKENTVVIDINDNEFDMLVIGVDDCEETVSLIEHALQNKKTL